MLRIPFLSVLLVPNKQPQTEDVQPFSSESCRAGYFPLATAMAKLIFSRYKRPAGQEGQYQGKFLKVSCLATSIVNDFLNGWHRLIKIVFGHFAVEGAATRANNLAASVRLPRVPSEHVLVAVHSLSEKLVPWAEEEEGIMRRPWPPQACFGLIQRAPERNKGGRS